MNHSRETIAAIATPVGTSGIGVIRISGEDAIAVCDRVFRPHGRKNAGRGKLAASATHTAHYGQILDPANGEVLDDVLVLVMKGPGTYTGEDTAEIDCHGGIYVLQRVLQAVLESGARMAEPGEFTKRAFLNGRLDLAQAESVMDVISASSDLALRAAHKRLSGRLGSKIDDLRRRIMDLLVVVEVEIDYPEYEIDEVEDLDLKRELDRLVTDLDALYRTADTGRLLREGIRVTIAGRPNMGKSTLLNAFLGEDRAIVTNIPGTTRDTLEESMNLDGIPIRLVDTAGMRETADPAEQQGVQRAKDAVWDSDLVLVLIAADEERTPEDEALLSSLADSGKPYLVVRTKTDLAGTGEGLPSDQEVFVSAQTGEGLPSDQEIQISAKTGEGMDGLKSRIRSLVLSGAVQADDGVYLANTRQKQAVFQALEAVREGIVIQEAALGTDMIGTQLQKAYDALGEVTGNSVQEDLIDTIFSRFCLGK
ncbi:MAG: tRNA uridine-5-carboxymethylaminomethyl(34) synthesis GTPase MnmE [Firmicutes bacterium]|nr:tRNA uridine-5-carboxymethylaminomethyl(34) synthesis GTPase MnmE [Bacillota bacterium]